MNALINTIKNKFPKLKIAVIGDIMLDQYYRGEVDKISPEAPVPVNRIKTVSSVLGGAANVAANISGLGCKSYIMGVAGKDKNFQLLDKLMAETGIDSTGIIKRMNYSTITKLRVLGANQQMIRLDFEEILPLKKEEENLILENIQKLIEQGLDGIILSDYAKGVCTKNLCKKIIDAAKDNGVTVLVDPKGNDWEKYNGADFITPNLKELCEITSKKIPNENDKVLNLIYQLNKIYTFKNIVITRAEKGMTLFNSSSQAVVNSKALAREVYDVSGAGDTVTAALLAGILSGMNFETVTYFSNIAAGIVVGKVGTVAIDKKELIEKLLIKEAATVKNNKIVSLDELTILLEEWRVKGEKVVFTNGCFDILHSGHVIYLKKAAELGEHLIVGLNSDASVKRLKGNERPINKELDRAMILSELECVDRVIIFEEDTPKKLVQHIRPSILVKGGDYEINQIEGREYADEVCVVQFQDGYSTTNVIDKIKKLVMEDKL